jgi:activator of HSP90 ATPase
VVGTVVTITQNINFICCAKDIYDCFIDEKKCSLWTRGKVQVSKDVGSQFSLFDGNVTGKITELVPNKRICMDWRLKTWPASHFSQVRLDFTEGSESTEVKLTQQNVPLGEKDVTENNWRGYYWTAIKQRFGYGALL